MSYVLSLTASPADLEALAPGMIGLARDYPEQSERNLPGGLAEVDATEAETAAFVSAERAFRDSQQKEIAAREAKDQAVQSSREWCSSVLDHARVLAKHEKDANVLERLVVQGFAYVGQVREGDLPAYLEDLSRAAADQAKVMTRSGYTAETLAQGETLAAALRDAQRQLKDATTKRKAALTSRDIARTTLVRRLRRLDDFLGLDLPAEGKTRLASLRMICLPLRSSPEPEASEDPVDGGSDPDETG